MSHPVPQSLGDAGAKLWKSITDGITYRPDELAILESACLMADQISEYLAALDGEPLTVRGSAGQEVIHPVRAEVRALSMAQATLLGRLDVPEEEVEDDEAASRTMSRTEAARKAARARWGGR